MVEGHMLKVSGLGPTQTEVPPKKGGENFQLREGT